MSQKQQQEFDQYKSVAQTLPSKHSVLQGITLKIWRGGRKRSLVQALSISTLSDETKKFHRDRYRDFFSRPKFLRPRPRLFFETKYFRDRYRDFFLRPNVFETDTETFFETKCFRDRYRDFFSRPNVFETDTETFLRPNFFETDTETFAKVKK